PARNFFREIFACAGDPNALSRRKSAMDSLDHSSPSFGLTPAAWAGVRGRLFELPGRDCLMEGSQHSPGAARSDWSVCIVSIAHKHDKEAFAALFRHFAPRVKSYLLRCHVEA